MEEESNEQNETLGEEKNRGLLSYGDDDKQSLFRIFGVEMTAPKGLKNPRIVYISFIVVNFLLVFFLRGLLAK